MPCRPPERISVCPTIDSEDARQRWQYRCPKGHTQWEPTKYHFFCAACAKSHDPDVHSEIDLLVDKKTKQVYKRDEVR